MAESSLSPHSTNETHNVNQSLMNMTVMTKMIESLFQYPMQSGINSFTYIGSGYPQL